MPPLKSIVAFLCFSLILITVFWPTQLVLNQLQSFPCDCPVCDLYEAEKSSSVICDSISTPGMVESVDNKTDSRILVWVLTGPSRHTTHALHVKRTWGAHFDKLLFMSSKHDERLGAIALPNVTEGHDKLWPKTQKAFAHIWEHHKYDADWFMKADDDTFVVSHNLRDYLKDLDPSEPYYLGHNMKWHDVSVPVNYGGTGYILSKAALILLIKAFHRGGDCHTEIRKKYKGDEDTELGLCMQSMSVFAKNVLDAHGREKMIIAEVSGNFEDVFANFNGTWPRENQHWSHKPISFHQVTPSRMYLLEHLAHTLKIF